MFLANVNISMWECEGPISSPCEGVGSRKREEAHRIKSFSEVAFFRHLHAFACFVLKPSLMPAWWALALLCLFQALHQLAIVW